MLAASVTPRQCVPGPVQDAGGWVATLGSVMTLEEHIANFERYNGRRPLDFAEIRDWYVALSVFNATVAALAKRYIGPDEQMGLLVTRVSASELAEVEAFYAELGRFKAPSRVCVSFFDEITFPRGPFHDRTGESSESSTDAANRQTAHSRTPCAASGQSEEGENGPPRGTHQRGWKRRRKVA
jgi:hypothetical protein